MTMKAAALYGPHEMRLETVEKPSIRSNEILVKVKACGICGTDLHDYKIGTLSTPDRSKILGHEFSGEVVGVGSAVDGLNVGDRVLGVGLRGCGKCHWCQQGQEDRCDHSVVPGWGLAGAFAEYVVVPNPVLGGMFFKIPESLSWERAALIEPIAAACHAVKLANIKPDEKVVVLGAGIIGQGVAQVSKAMGASMVIVSEPSPKRRAVAKSLGADVVFDPNDVDPIEAVMKATSEQMADVVFECSGVPAAFLQGAQMVRRFGRMIEVAVFENTLELDPETMFRIIELNITLQGSWGVEFSTALELVSKGQIKIDDLITHEFPLDRIKEAFETQVNSDEAIKVLVKP